MLIEKRHVEIEVEDKIPYAVIVIAVDPTYPKTKQASHS